MADSCDAGIRPNRPLAACRERRSGSAAAHPLTIRSICRGSTRRGMKNPLAPASARASALDRFVDQRRVMRLRLDVQVGAGVDEKLVADGAADRLDALRLQRKRYRPSPPRTWSSKLQPIAPVLPSGRHCRRLVGHRNKRFQNRPQRQLGRSAMRFAFADAEIGSRPPRRASRWHQQRDRHPWRAPWPRRG